MAEVISRKSFCEMAGIKTNHISTYAKRGNIKVRPDGRIDISLQINKAFLQKALEKKKSSGPVRGNTSKDSNEDSAFVEKRRIELEMKKRDLMMKDIQLQKMNGEVVPTDLVGSMMKAYIRQLQIELKNTFERWASDLVIKLNGSRQEIAKSRTMIAKNINRSSEKAHQGMLQQLTRIADEYRGARSK